MGGPALIASLAIALCAQLAAADFDCREAPDNDMETTCKMIQEWDSNARKAISRRQAFQQANPVGAPGVPGNPGLSPMVPQQFPSQPQDCMSIACICTHMGGRSNGNTCTLRNGQQMGMAIRKEYRMMTMPEKMRFHNAVLALKRSGEYDRISIMHRQVGSSSGAHSGPGFLPWHREYMKRIEIALRMVDPGVALPYWDSTLDNHLPDPRDSIMFSHMFMGEMDASGQVVKGAFAGFRTLEGRPNIIRRLGSEGKLFREENINSLLAQNQIQNVLAYTAPQNGCPFRPNFAAIEYTHSSVHLWVGGDMKPPTTSANDPIFFLHHCFVDFLWEMWRQLRQNRFARESAYPPDIGTCANQQHFSYANMRPWAKQNKDGLSNVYTDQLFRYQPRPTCSRQNPNCGSAYLFCDTRGAPHCVAKVKENGLCRGFEGFDVCFMGTCQAGWCRPGGGGAAAAPQTTALAVAPQASSQAWSPVPQTAQTTAAPAAPATAGNCFNDDPCCDAWARTGECTSNRNYMQRYCKRSCRFCASNDNRQGCVDRHQSCAYWRTQNYCTRRRQWMAENCQAACGWCNLGPQQLCQSTARMFAA